MDNHDRVIPIQPEFTEFDGDNSNSKNGTSVYKYTGLGEEFQEKFINSDKTKIWRSANLDVEMIEIEAD